MTDLADLSSAAIFDLLCAERSRVAPAEERAEARAVEARARASLLDRPDAGHVIAATLPLASEPRAALALHRHRVRCGIASGILAALPLPHALEGILPSLASTDPDVAEAVRIALLDRAEHGEVPFSTSLLAPEVAPLSLKRALVAIAKQGRAMEVLDAILALARRHVDVDLCLNALAAAAPETAPHLAALAHGEDPWVASLALDQLQALRERGHDGGLALGVARALLQREDAAAAGFLRAEVLCRVLLDDEARAMAFARGDGGRSFDTPGALIEGLRRWIEPAPPPRAGDVPVRPTAERCSDRIFALTVPLPGGDVGVLPVLGRIRAILGAQAEGPRRFHPPEVQRLVAAGRTLCGYRFGTWIEGADPHAIMLGELCSPGEDPLGIAALAQREREPPSAGWIAELAGHLGRLRAGHYLAAWIAVKPVLHPAEGPRPFWEPTRRDDDAAEIDEDDEPEPSSPFRAPYYVARAAVDDVGISFLPVFSGTPEESSDLCVAYAWPRPDPAAGPRSPIRLYAAVFAGEGALLRASRGGPPATVLCVAPAALAEDYPRFARAFAALGAIAIP